MVDSPVAKPPGSEDAPGQESSDEEPVGTLAILILFLILVIGLWIAVYVTLWERS